MRLAGAVLVLVFALFWFLGSAARGAEDGPKTLNALDAEIARMIAASPVPGAVVAIVENGEVRLAKGYGLADVDAGTPMTADTILRAGSLSKNLTSLGVLRLVGEQALALDAPLSEVAPEIVIDNPWTENYPILLSHLLEHTAGIEGSTYYEYAFSRPGVAPKTYAQMMAGKLDVAWPPGFYYSYANPGHTLAAVAMENACNCSYDDFMENEIFAPLGMTSSTFLLDRADQGRIGKSYRSDGVTESSFWLMAIRPSGSLLTTANDLGKLMRFYATRGQSAPGLVAPALLKRMETPSTSAAARQGVVDGGYGLGNFGFFAGDGHIFRGHSGATDGYKTWTGYDPVTGRGFAFIINGEDEGARAALRNLIGGYLTRDYPPADLRPSISVKDGSAYDGWYAPITHNMKLRRWLWTMNTAVHLSVQGDIVAVAPLSPTNSSYALEFMGDGLLRRPGRAIATAAFVTGPAGETVFINGGAYERVSAIRVLGTFTIFVAGLLTAAIVSMHLLLWAPMAAFGRLPQGAGRQVRAALFAAGAALLGVFALFATQSLLAPFDQLVRVGTVSFVSISMCALSVIGPAAVAFAAWRLFSVSFEHRIFRYYAAVATVVLCLAWGLLAVNGWVPLITWLP